MTRKDYIIIAAVFKQMLEDPASAAAGPIALKRAAERMAHALKQDNSRFDYSRFLAACGIKETV